MRRQVSRPHETFVPPRIHGETRGFGEKPVRSDAAGFSGACWGLFPNKFLLQSPLFPVAALHGKM